MNWKIRRRELEIGKRTLVMGILNITPDSFSDGGKFLDAETAVARGKGMLDEGADILDVGGESTRPGASPVSVSDEIARVVPVVERLHRETGAVISVDTTKAEVASAAVAAGADIINDVSALKFDPGMAAVAAETGAGLVLMHMQGTPRDMQNDPRYENLIGEIVAFLRERGEEAVRAGVSPETIVYDPGIGFGKTYDHNLEIMARLKEFRMLGRPLLVGLSRKAFIGRVLGDMPPKERIEGTAAAVALAVGEGADIVRVHDVAAMVKVARVADAICRSPSGDLRAG